MKTSNVRETVLSRKVNSENTCDAHYCDGRDSIVLKYNHDPQHSSYFGINCECKGCEISESSVCFGIKRTLIIWLKAVYFTLNNI